MRNALRLLYLRVLGFQTVSKSSYLPQTRHAKNMTDAFQKGGTIFCAQKIQFYEGSPAKKHVRNAIRRLYLRFLEFCWRPRTPNLYFRPLAGGSLV